MRIDPLIWMMAVIVALWACVLLGQIARYTYRWMVGNLRRSATVVPIDDRRRQQLSALAQGRDPRVLIVLILLLTAPVAAQTCPCPGPIGVAPYGVLLAGAGLDLGSTLVALKNPALGEGNPLLQQGGTAGLVAVKAGVTTAAVLAMRALARRGHPKLATVLGYTLGAVTLAATIHNVRVSR